MSEVSTPRTNFTTEYIMTRMNCQPASRRVNHAAVLLACVVPALGGPVRADFGLSPPFRVNVNGDVDPGRDSVPVLVIEGGLMIVVWNSLNAPDGSLGSDIDLHITRTSDGGATWSTPVPLNTNAATDTGHDTEAAIATDGNGNWVAVWSSGENLGDTIGTDDDIFVARSADDGFTWTAPAVLNSNAAIDSRSEHDHQVSIATDRAGAWIVVWNGQGSELPQPGTTDIIVSRSVDNGLTWSPQDRIDLATASDIENDLEPVIACDGFGNWLVVWTRLDPSGGSDADIAVTRSVDVGVTWSAPMAVNSYAGTDTAGDYSPTLVTDGNGFWLVAWMSNAIPPGGQLGPDNDILVARSLDVGVTWSLPQVVNSNAAIDEGDDRSPHSAMDSLGNLLIVWDTNGQLPSGAFGADRDIVGALSLNAGESWIGPYYINIFAPTDIEYDGNARVVFTRPGEAIVVWDSFNTESGSPSSDGDLLGAFVLPLNSVPAVSSWALVILALMVLSAGSIIHGKRARSF